MNTDALSSYFQHHRDDLLETIRILVTQETPSHDKPRLDAFAALLAQRLTAAGADWQIHAYGGTLHAFTRPDANDPERGIRYSATADRRSWRALEDFLEELFVS